MAVLKLCEGRTAPPKSGISPATATDAEASPVVAAIRANLKAAEKVFALQKR